MYKKVVFLAVLVVTVCCILSSAIAQGMNNSLSKQEKKEGWHLLFNGKNLKGWHTYLKKDVTPAWKVRDGAIGLDHSNNAEGGDLVTDAEYQNFELSLEWKISEEGNSGIIFDVHEAPEYHETYLTGPEMQVLDNKNAEDNKKENHLAGSLYDIIAANPQTANPAGEWNKVRIRLDNGHLTFWMNGKKVVETQMWNKDWQELVNNSKFRDWKGFAAYKKGHIALQDHGHAVWYKDIKIKML